LNLRSISAAWAVTALLAFSVAAADDGQGDAASAKGDTPAAKITPATCDSSAQQADRAKKTYEQLSQMMMDKGSQPILWELMNHFWQDCPKLRNIAQQPGAPEEILRLVAALPRAEVQNSGGTNTGQQDQAKKSPAQAENSSPHTQDWFTNSPYFVMSVSALIGAFILALVLLALRWTRGSDDGSELEPIPSVPGHQGFMTNNRLNNSGTFGQRLAALEHTAAEMQQSAGAILESTRGVESLPLLLKSLEHLERLIRWHAQILEETGSAPRRNDTDHLLGEMRDAVKTLVQRQQRLEDAVVRTLSESRRPISQPPPPVSSHSNPVEPARSQPQAVAQDLREPELVRRLVEASNQVLSRVLTQAKFREEFRAIWVTRSADGRLLATDREPSGQMADGFLLARTERAARTTGTQRGFLVPGLNFFDRRSALGDPRAVQAVFGGVFEVQETSGDRLIEPATVVVDGETVKVVRKGILQFGR
jgi:hypothetical protein